MKVPQRYSIEWTASAKRCMGQLPAKVVPACFEFIVEVLAENPRRFGRPLRNELVGYHSVRRGTCRVFYEIDDDRRAVVIIRIDRRAMCITCAINRGAVPAHDVAVIEDETPDFQDSHRRLASLAGAVKHLRARRPTFLCIADSVVIPRWVWERFADRPSRNERWACHLDRGRSCVRGL